MRKALVEVNLRPSLNQGIFGRPDFVFRRARVAVFCDSHFWHGYRWKTRQKELRRNRSFWIAKIESNMRRDKIVTRSLRRQGWTVIRFWEHDILESPLQCARQIKLTIMQEEIKQ
jgi:DNA mismatch endonuclease Vsr